LFEPALVVGLPGRSSWFSVRCKDLCVLLLLSSRLRPWPLEAVVGGTLEGSLWILGMPELELLPSGIEASAALAWSTTTEVEHLVEARVALAWSTNEVAHLEELG
jgi:hypothetical protein